MNRASCFPLVRARLVSLCRSSRRRLSRLVLESLESRQLLSVSSLASAPVAAPPSLIATPLATSTVLPGLTASQVSQSYAVGWTPPTSVTTFPPGTLSASFVLSGGGSSGLAGATGTMAGTTSGSTTSTTSLFPANFLVIIVPIGSKEVEVVLVLPPPVVPASHFAATSHYVESQSSLNLTEPGSDTSMLGAPAMFGQGPAIGLPLPLYQRINPQDQIPSLLDLVTPIPAKAPHAPPRQAARQDRMERTMMFPEAGVSILSMLDQDRTRSEAPGVEAVRPAPIALPALRRERRDREEEKSPTASTASTLAGVAAIAGSGYWMTLRESGRRKPAWIPGRFDASRPPLSRRIPRPVG
ncbi:MAG: hypothetical protein ACP5XB_25905 [Isosphaeraceae bacterium]